MKNQDKTKNLMCKAVAAEALPGSPVLPLHSADLWSLSSTTLSFVPLIYSHYRKGSGKAAIGTIIESHWDMEEEKLSSNQPLPSLAFRL